MAARFHLGTQSWSFRAWVGPFYPPGTHARDMLDWYARMFGTVEVDSTFYAKPAEPVLRGWCDQVGDDFEFSLKIPQQITHVARLAGVEDAVRDFTDRLRRLEDRLGVLLVQLSPDFVPSSANRAVLRDFVDGLAQDIRWAVEFRHPGWLDDETWEVLHRRNVALTLVDGRWIRPDRMVELAERPTADFAYVRWMGMGRKLSDYSAPQIDREDALTTWGEALKSLGQRVETIYGYFNNQFQGHSPHSARTMQRLVGLEPVEPLAVRPQGELF